MQIVRTVVWIVITAILVAFVAMNWGVAAVNFWPIEDGYLYFEWPVGVIAIIFFVLGFFPMWMLNRAQSWRLKRRVSSLENSLRAAATVTPVAQEEGITAINVENTQVGTNVP